MRYLMIATLLLAACGGSPQSKPVCEAAGNNQCTMDCCMPCTPGNVCGAQSCQSDAECKALDPSTICRTFPTGLPDGGTMRFGFCQPEITL